MINALKILKIAMQNKQSTIRSRLLNLKKRNLQRKIAYAATKFIAKNGPSPVVRI